MKKINDSEVMKIPIAKIVNIIVIIYSTSDCSSSNFLYMLLFSYVQLEALTADVSFHSSPTNDPRWIDCNLAVTKPLFEGRSRAVAYLRQIISLCTPPH